MQPLPPTAGAVSARNADPRHTVCDAWLEREAGTDSRPAEAHAADAQSLHEGWAAQTPELGLEPADVIEHAIDQVAGRDVVDRATTLSMIDTAMATISEKQSSWRPTELLRELAALVPTDTVLSTARLVELLNKLTVHVVDNYCIDVSSRSNPDALLRKDRRPVTESVVDRALTKQSILDQGSTDRLGRPLACLRRHRRTGGGDPQRA